MTDTARPRISVVNDNADFLELMSAILDDDAGYDVTVFSGESTAIADIAAADPALIIVDLLLGGASGWEIVTLARADERLADVPIIICSADVIALRDRDRRARAHRQRPSPGQAVRDRRGDRPRRAPRRSRPAGRPVAPAMADEPLITPIQLQRTQIDADRELLRDEDLLNEEHLRRMDQVLLRRNLDHVRMFSRKLSLELQQYVHLYTPEANELRRRIEKYMVMERMVEREMARRHTY